MFEKRFKVRTKRWRGDVTPSFERTTKCWWTFANISNLSNLYTHLLHLLCTHKGNNSPAGTWAKKWDWKQYLPSYQLNFHSRCELITWINVVDTQFTPISSSNSVRLLKHWFDDCLIRKAKGQMQVHGNHTVANNHNYTIAKKAHRNNCGQKVAALSTGPSLSTARTFIGHLYGSTYGVWTFRRQLTAHVGLERSVCWPLLKNEKNKKKKSNHEASRKSERRTKAVRTGFLRET